MSHFVMGVILPEGVTYRQASPHINTILAPFDENLEVEPYLRDCWCIGGESGKHGAEMANKLIGSWDERRALFKAAPEYQAVLEAQAALAFRDPGYAEAEKIVQKAWEAFIASYNQAWEETKYDYTINHPDYAQAESNCADCKGSGQHETTYNPQSEWDWYSIGGRYKNWAFGSDHFMGAEALLRVSDDKPLLGMFGFVTPEGEWIEKGDMGWWGIVSNPTTETAWEATRREIYTRYASHWIVCVDCHI